MPVRIDELLQMLASSDLRIRVRALLILGHEQHMLPLDQLKQIYDEGDTGIHIAVLKYLRQNLPPGHHEIVLKALTDSTKNVRLEAVEYLIQYPNANAAPILEALLKNPDFSRRERVISALVACDDGRTTHVLMSLIEDSAIPERTFAGRMLGLVNVEPIVDRLLALLTSEDEITVRAAISALENFKDPSIIDPLLIVIDKWRTTSKSWVAYEAIHLLDKFRDARIRDLLFRLLSTNSPISGLRIELGRSTAIDMLGNYPEPQVIQYLTELLQHGSHSDRHAALYAFTKIGGEQTVDLLLSACLLETDPHVLGKYSWAFTTLGDKRAVPMLEALLERVEPLHRSTIESNLRLLNSPLQKPIKQTLFARIKTRLHLRR